MASEITYKYLLPTDFKNYKKKEYSALLQDPNVRRWYNNLSKSSAIVADIYLRRLGAFCRKVKLTPAQYAKLSLGK